MTTSMPFTPAPNKPASQALRDRVARFGSAPRKHGHPGADRDRAPQMNPEEARIEEMDIFIRQILAATTDQAAWNRMLTDFAYRYGFALPRQFKTFSPSLASQLHWGGLPLVVQVIDLNHQAAMRQAIQAAQAAHIAQAGHAGQPGQSGQAVPRERTPDLLQRHVPRDIVVAREAITQGRHAFLVRRRLLGAGWTPSELARWGL